MTNRILVPEAEIEFAIRELRGAIKERIAKHGPNSFIGKHEIYGVLAEEFDEYLEAIRDDQNVGAQVGELFDIAVAAIFGIASLRTNVDASKRAA